MSAAESGVVEGAGMSSDESVLFSFSMDSSCAWVSSLSSVPDTGVSGNLNYITIGQIATLTYVGVRAFRCRPVQSLHLYRSNRKGYS